MVDAAIFSDTIGAAPEDTMSDLIGVMFHQPFGALGAAAVKSKDFSALC